ncbi:dihydropteroate synthase [uncultured Fusobacterium sp.]|jgi:dihydropteroate synthase|uniref:dihydropteroate synthase n=1 Tax=uncultured Fusobacterium sp. TaxID=159267 RepID=UPI0015A6728B|nr:dihydropteroate synthase [uncultured Fusobacterium sp.]
MARIIKVKDKEIEIGKRTLVMGILNVTPDSFSDGGDFFDVTKAIEHAKEMVRDGADIIDIGGMSTRQGHEDVPVEEEIRRVVPIIEKLSKELDVLISVDTYRWEVAEKALEAGAHILNDVWGLQYDNGEMACVIAKYDPIVIVMHNQNSTEYDKDIILSMREFFERSFELIDKNNIPREKVFIDPGIGIGFGKDFDQNIEVLRRMDELKDIAPILLGTSRKTFIGALLNNVPPKERCEGTIATSILGIEKGVEIVRVHDVLENKKALLVADKLVRG